MTDSMQQARERAQYYFDQGFNCAESVTMAFLDRDDVNLPAEIVALASGFGGGLGRTRNTCGAVTGAVLSLGMLYGRNPAALANGKARHDDILTRYPRFQTLVTEMEKTLGTLKCSEITAPAGDFANPARRAICRNAVGECAALCAKYAEESIEL